MATSTAPTVPIAPGRIPGFGHLLTLRRDPLGFLRSLTCRGDVVKIYLGPLPAYVVTRPDLVHQILVTDVGSFEKGRLFDKARGFLGDGIMTSGGAFHRRQRRLMQPAFHREKINHYLAEMDRKAREFASGWTPGQVVELQEELDELTLRIVATALFSADLGQKAITEIHRSLPIVVRGVTVRTLIPMDLLHKLPLPANLRFTAAAARIRQVIDDAIAAYRAEAIDHGDLLSMVLAARDDDTGLGMTDHQVRDEVVTLMLTGSDPTASTLGSAFYEIGRNPAVQARLHAELDTALAGRPITAEDLPKLRYTQQVLTEAMRMHTPAWILMRRTTTEVTLGGLCLPAGTEVLFSLPVIHRNPDLYPDPDSFDPDRWLRRPAGELPHGAYLPFGEGNRQCIGNTFARAEMIIIVASVVSRWHLTPVPGAEPKRLFRGISRLDSVAMTVTPRSQPTTPVSTETR